MRVNNAKHPSNGKTRVSLKLGAVYCSTMSSSWIGESRFEVGRIHYSGPAGDNAMHRHAALQLVLQGKGVRYEGGFCDVPFYVRPMAAHQLEQAEQVELLLIEPSSRFGQALLRALPAEPIGTLPKGSMQLEHDGDTRAAQIPEPLVRALEHLSGEGALQRTIGGAARAAGVSVSRLRAMANRALGVSLSRWRLWQALQTALQHLAEGDSIADAAFAAGFSDQAHLTRSMKATLGLTPGAVLAGVGLR